MSSNVEIAIAAIAIAILILLPKARRVVSRVLGLAIALAAIAVAIGGSAVLMNDVSISDPPGISPRIRRFLTMNQAATSEKGLGSAECPWQSPGAGARQMSSNIAAARPEHRESPGAEGEGRADQEDQYPELVRHGYPGISRAQLFQLAAQTVAGLGGWKIVRSDPRGFNLDCLYTSRVFQWNDQVRIFVTPRSEVDLCSRSGTDGSLSRPWLGLFPGDFGANLGHIKQFYEALEPRADEVYKEQERKANNKP